METIGEKIRYYREKRGYSRSDFCDVEEKLTIRQLSRIENGDSNPTSATIQYIAERLDLPSYRLMPDFKDLPEDYKELKYLLLRLPVYSSPKLLQQHEIYLDMVDKEFYEILPEEEKYVVECLRAIFELHTTKEMDSAQSLIEQYADEFLNKSYFTINDLAFFRALSGYLSTLYKKGNPTPYKLALIFETSFVKLLKQADLFAINTLFVYENSILSCLTYYGLEQNYSLFQESINLLKNIIEKTQNYQKKPLIFMLEWKVQLFLQHNLSQAIEKYYHARNLAKLLEDDEVSLVIETEWQQDLKIFSKKNKFF